MTHKYYQMNLNAIYRACFLTQTNSAKKQELSFLYCTSLQLDVSGFEMGYTRTSMRMFCYHTVTLQGEDWCLKRIEHAV